MIDALKTVFRHSWRYAAACPVLFLIPVVFELIQHAIEFRLRFYDSTAAMVAAESEPARMIMGHVKIIALFLTGYWAIRFVAFDGDRKAASRFDPVAVRLFLPVLAWGLLALVVIQDGPLLGRALDLPARPIGIGLLALLVASFFFEPCLATWKAAAAIGDGRVGFVRSITLTRACYAWALGVSLLVIMPLMVVHYGLAFLSVGRSFGVTWAALAFDSVLVGFMGAAMSISNLVIARRVADRAGLTLTPHRSEGMGPLAASRA